MVLKLPKTFLQICADRKKPKYIKAIYFYSSERSYHVLSENSIFLGVRDINTSRDIKEQNIKKSGDWEEI